MGISVPFHVPFRFVPYVCSPLLYSKDLYPYIFKKNLVAGFSKVFHHYGNCLTKKSSHENFPLRLQTGGMKEKVTSSFSSIKSHEYPKKLLSACVCLLRAKKQCIYIYIYMYFNICMRIKVLRGIVYTLAYFSFIYFSITMDYIYTFNIYIYT